MKTKEEEHKCYIINNSQASPSSGWIKFIGKGGVRQSVSAQCSKGEAGRRLLALRKMTQTCSAACRQILESCQNWTHNGQPGKQTPASVNTPKSLE